ncbi:hypothetical protein K501DRAFT_329412 [Backusella circina FSU 941]|nr:hypothetical protein K501DRAFT_329412 [Backusella circina FSU 941]
MDSTENKTNGLCELPTELILRIAEHLEFSDIWYLGTCSRCTRLLAYRLLHTKYQIDLIQPRIISPFSQLLHGAVAFLGRHGYSCENSTVYIEPSVLQSVANHMVIAMHDRIPTKIGRSFSLDFILDKTLGLLIEHSLNDPTLRIGFSGVTSVDPKFMEDLQKQQQQDGHDSTIDMYTTIEPTGILLVDYLATLYPTLTALFDIESTDEIHHRLLVGHINRQLDHLRTEYHNSNNDLAEIKFCLFIRFLCALIKTNLVTPSDIKTMVQDRISAFFMTQPSDVILSNGNLIFLKSTEWKLWLKEIQLRLKVLIDLMKALIKQHYGDPSELYYVNAILQETARAFSMSRLVNTNDVNN